MVCSCSGAGRPRRRTWSTVWAPIVTTLEAANWTNSDGVSGRASGGGAAEVAHCSETASRTRWISATGSGKQVATHRLEVLARRSTNRARCGRFLRSSADEISRIPDGRERRSVPRRSHQNPLWLPRTPLVTKTVMGIPLASAIGNALVRLSTYPSSKVTTTRGRRDGREQFGKGRRLTMPSDLVEVRGKLGGGHAELEGVIDTLRNPVIAENERSSGAPCHDPFVLELRTIRRRSPTSSGRASRRPGGDAQ